MNLKSWMGVAVVLLAIGAAEAKPLRAGHFDEGSWLLCPALNPTGLAAGTRDNSDGVDLNRDYLNRRSSEVLAHAAWLESLPEDWPEAIFLAKLGCPLSFTFETPSAQALDARVAAHAAAVRAAVRFHGSLRDGRRDRCR